MTRHCYRKSHSWHADDGSHDHIGVDDDGHHSDSGPSPTCQTSSPAPPKAETKQFSKKMDAVISTMLSSRTDAAKQNEKPEVRQAETSDASTLPSLIEHPDCTVDSVK